MECFSAILLFDAFSARKRTRVVHWVIVTAVAFLDATLLNFAATTMPTYSKIVIVLALFFPLHRLLYTSNRIFSLYIVLLIISVAIILVLAPCNNSAIHCSNEELRNMKIAVRKRLILYCLIIPAFLLLKPLYSIIWIVAAAADALLLVLAKIGVGIK